MFRLKQNQLSSISPSSSVPRKMQIEPRSVTWSDREKVKTVEPNTLRQRQSILKKPENVKATDHKNSDRRERLSSSRCSVFSSQSFAKSEYREFGPKTLIAEYNAKDQQTYKKYLASREALLQQNALYTDYLFPPQLNSVVNSGKNLQSQLRLARWVRLPQIFKLVEVLGNQEQGRSFCAGGKCPRPLLQALEVMASRRHLQLGCLDQSSREVSKSGIYCLKICQEGIWRHVVVDDYYPVIEGVPLFITATGSTAQLWPFLLVKALAKIYGTFQALLKCNMANTLHQLTGVMPSCLVKTEDEDYSPLLDLRKHDVLYAVNLSGNMYVVNRVCKQVGRQVDVVQFIDPLGELAGVKVKRQGQLAAVGFQWLSCHFTAFYLLRVNQDDFYVGRPVRQSKECDSLRWMRVPERTSCVLSLVQKDEKHFRGADYKYSWARLLLCQKDIDGYRYICGGYSNQKVLWIKGELLPGEYCLIVIMQWQSRPYELVLTYSGERSVPIERNDEEALPDVISEVGLDICQRFGVHRQVNKNLCIYSVVHAESGLVIQNFNNENQTMPLNLKKGYQRNCERRVVRELSRLLNPSHFLLCRILPKNSVTVVLQVLGGRLNEVAELDS